jgi:hypothetical protein
MRKLIVTIMSATLLIVSSAPMVAAAADCPPAHEAAMTRAGADYHAHVHDLQQQGRHDHAMALIGDWQNDRIECGCGCHSSVDSLPHLLAPHMASDAVRMTGQLSIKVSLQPGMAWQSSPVRVPLPPPQYNI